jgi:hypothetical protein
LTEVGGTLWPGNWAATEALERERLDGLQAALPQLSPTRCEEFHRYLRAHYWPCGCHAERTAPLVQVTRAAIRQAAQHFALPTNASQVEVIRAALCPSPLGHLALFLGRASWWSAFKS